MPIFKTFPAAMFNAPQAPTDDSMPVGTLAEKIGGSFQATGVIVGNFKTLEGAQRYVFEFDTPRGMLHIYGPAQLRSAK